MRPIALVATLALFLVGCNMTPPIKTAADLAAALKRNGVAYTTATPEAVGEIPVAKIDEGLTLTGENLNVIILRITDARTYKVATSATFLLGFVKAATPETPQQPPDIYLSEPFVVLIRLEPAQGMVRTALEKTVPEDVVE